MATPTLELQIPREVTGISIASMVIGATITIIGIFVIYKLITKRNELKYKK